MTCKHALRLLELSRPGELGPRERRRLEVHLRRCPVCAAAREKNLESGARIARAREFAPCLEDESGLAASIMGAIRRRGPAPAERERAAGRPGFPAFARLLALSVVAFMAIMTIQTWTVLKKVSALEKDMASRGALALASREDVPSRFLAVETVVDPEMNPEAGPDSRGRIVLEKASLEELLSLARSLSEEDFGRLERILDRTSFRPRGTSIRPVPEEDRAFLIRIRNELRLRLRGR
jgi:hypothetical protein